MPSFVISKNKTQEELLQDIKEGFRVTEKEGTIKFEGIVQEIHGTGKQ